MPFASKQRVLGVTIDSLLSFDDRITGVVRVGSYHIRALRHILTLNRLRRGKYN